MRKLLRIAGYAIAAAGLLLGGALIALKIAYPPAKLKAIAVEKLAASLGRSVRVESVGIAIGGINVTGVEISEAPNFDAGTFLKAGHIIVRIKLLPLLHKHVELAQIYLSDWTCRIVKNRDGSLNVSTLGKPAEPQPAQTERDAVGKVVLPARGSGRKRPLSASASKSEETARPKPSAAPAPHEPENPAAAFTIDRVQSLGGAVRYEDRGTGDWISLTEIDADARKAQIEKAFPIDLRFTYAGKIGASQPKGLLIFRGIADLGGLNQAKMKFDVKSLRVQHMGMRADVSGQIANLSSPEVNLSLSMPKHSAEDLKSIFTLPPWLSELPAVNGEVHVKMRGNTIEIEKADISTSETETAQHERIPAGRIHLAGTYAGDALTIREAKIEAGKLEAKAAGTLRMPAGQSPSADLHVETNRFPLQDAAAFIPSIKDYKLQGEAAITFASRGNLDSPALSGSADLRGISLVYSGQDFTNINGAAHFSPDAMSAKIKGLWNKSELDIDVDVKNYQKEPNIKFEGFLTQLDLAKVAEMSKSETAAPAKTASKPLPNRPADQSAPNGSPSSAAGGTKPQKAGKTIHSTGKIAISKIVHPNFNATDARLAWSLSSLEPTEMSGSAQLNIGSGKFDKLDLLAGESPVVRVALMPLLILQKVAGLVKIPLFPAFDRVNFKEITGDYHFNKGLMTVKESHLNSDVAYVSTAGTVDLAREQLDLHVSTKIGTQVGLKLSGPLGFTVKGPISSPSVKVDLASIVEQPAVKDAIEQGKKLLNNLFK